VDVLPELYQYWRRLIFRNNNNDIPELMLCGVVDFNAKIVLIPTTGVAFIA